MTCSRDTDGDGNCGRPLCPECGGHRVDDKLAESLGGGQLKSVLLDHPCRVCRERPQAVEIEGRVLVCEVCAADPELRAHAKENWR